jgi:small-conductance mechanosensitive channel
MHSFWEQVYGGNTVLAYALVIGGILLTWMVIRLIKTYLFALLETFTKKTAIKYDDILLALLQKFILPWAFMFINYTIIQQLNLHPKVEKILYGAFSFVTLFYAAGLVNHTIQLLISSQMRRRGETEERIRHLHGLLFVVKALVWILGLLTLANNFGYNVSTLLTSLGVGGIAIALASQAILGDLFSYLVIFFDKPFEIGDFVVVSSDVLGSIEYIGIKTTRIRSLSGEQLIISNTNMTNSTIRNYKRMERRRVVFTIKVPYTTSLKKLKLIPNLIKEVIIATPQTLFDRSHMAQYGDYSINYETVFYFLSDDYNKYMDVQQLIFFNIREAFDRNGIEFAYPTQSLYVDEIRKREPVENGER